MYNQCIPQNAQDYKIIDICIHNLSYGQQNNGFSNKKYFGRKILFNLSVLLKRL